MYYLKGVSMNNPSKNLKLAEQGALLAIVTYILLSTAKLIAGSMLHSSSLTADGFNNISDIVANIAVLIGLRMARKPADMDHKFGHWKIEDLASLITSLIMFFVGLDVLFETVQKIISKQVTAIDPLGAIVGFISAIIMTGVYLFNKKLAKRANSKALEAAAKDNLSDAITSLGTSIAIIASALNYPLVFLMDSMKASCKIISKPSLKFLKSHKLSPSEAALMEAISI